MSNEGPTKPINWEAIEELAGADNATVLKMLEDAGMAEPAVALDEDDLNAIKAGAMDAAAASREKKGAQELLKLSYTVYAKELRRIGDEAIKNMTNDALRDELVYRTGRYVDDEELDALRNSPLDVDDWLAARPKMTETQPNSVIAVDGDDNIIAAGATRAEALRRAQEEQGTKER